MAKKRESKKHFHVPGKPFFAGASDTLCGTMASGRAGGLTEIYEDVTCKNCKRELDTMHGEESSEAEKEIIARPNETA